MLFLIKHHAGEFFIISCNSMFSMAVRVYTIFCYYPDVQRNISRELNRFIMLNGRQPTFSDRLRLPCYASFQEQCFRYHTISITNTSQRLSKDSKFAKASSSITHSFYDCSYSQESGL